MFSKFTFDTESSAEHCAHVLAAGQIWFSTSMGCPTLFLPLALRFPIKYSSVDLNSYHGISSKCTGSLDIGLPLAAFLTIEYNPTCLPLAVPERNSCRNSGKEFLKGIPERNF